MCKGPYFVFSQSANTFINYIIGFLNIFMWETWEDTIFQMELNNLYYEIYWLI